MELRYEPTLGEWCQGISIYAEKLVRDMESIDCLSTKEIGSARKSKLLQIFVKDDPFVNEQKLFLNNMLEQIFLIPKIFLEKISEFQFLMDENLKKKLRKYKKFEEFKEEIEKMNRNKDEIERVIYQKVIKSSLFLIDCSNIKVNFYL